MANLRVDQFTVAPLPLELTDIIPIIPQRPSGGIIAMQTTLGDLQSLFAATPSQGSLGTVEPFNTLSGGVITTSCVTGTTIFNGNLGHLGVLTITPAGTITINNGVEVDGTTVPGAAALGTLTTPGTPLGDMRLAYNSMNALTPTFSYAPGAIDLATDVTTPSGIGIFTPGVYEITGAASIGAAGITLNGPGIYVFQIGGAFTTVGGIVSGGVPAVTLTNGATADNVFFVSIAAATLGAGSALFPTIFQGNIMTGSAAITTSAYNIITGRLLSESAITIACNNIISIPIASGASGSIAVLNTVFVSKSGNDSTGMTGRFDLPFLTIAAAQAVATSGQTVFIYPGTYSESGLGKAGLNYHFVNGVIVSSGASAMWVAAGGISYSITGDGEFNATSAQVINNIAGGVISMNAKKISNTSGNLLVSSNSSIIYANVDISVITTSGNCIVTGGAGTPAIYLTTKMISCTSGTVMALSPTGGIVYLTADTITGSGAVMLALTGTVVIKGGMTYTGTGVAILFQSGIATNTNIYGILLNSSSAKAIQDNGASGTINFHSAIIGIGYLDLAGTVATYNFYDEITTNITTQSSIVMTTGTVRCKSRITNLDANAASYGITKTTGTLLLENTIIKTTGGTESIHSVAAQNIKVLGKLVSNVAVSVNITDIAGGAFQTDTDVE